MKKYVVATLFTMAFSPSALALDIEWKMVVRHFDSMANTSHELMTSVTYDSGRKCHRDAYLMNVNSKNGQYSNLTTSDLIRYFCVALPKQS